MGKRKQQAPQRNPDTSQNTTSTGLTSSGHALDGVKRRRIEDEEDAVTIRTDTEQLDVDKDKIEQVLLLSINEIVKELFSDNDKVKVRVDRRDFIHALLHHAFMVDDSSSATCNANKEHDNVITCMHINQRIKSITSAVLEFELLDIFVVQSKQSKDTCNKDNNVDADADDLRRCVYRCSLSKSSMMSMVYKGANVDVECSSISRLRDIQEEFDIILGICLTCKSSMLAPSELSYNILGSNHVERKKPSIKAAVALRQALGAIFPGSVIAGVSLNPSGVDSPPIQARFVYDLVDNIQFNQVSSNEVETESNAPCTIDGLRPTLRKYQAHAVSWMLSREKDFNNDDRAWEVCWVVIQANNNTSSVIPLTKYRALHSNLLPKIEVLFNPFTGWVSNTIEEARSATIGDNYSVVKGGILAESMGLGKTVEVLACILSNPRPSCDVDLSLWHAVLQSERKNTYDTPSAIASIKQQQFLIQVQDNVCIICSTPVKKADRWVKCIECQELMHSDCAGYDSSDNTPFDCICSYLRCPCCSAKKYSENPIRSRATLIVTPPAILEQWAREIHRHCSKSMKVIIYPGVASLSKPLKRATFIDHNLYIMAHPHELADADVVLTTFSVLNKELFHSDNNFVTKSATTTNLRRKKRYRVLPSPLNSIEWWRVCLDEAQRVEGTTSAVARMALRLKAQNKWCVTGTPIGRGKFDDLFGLFLFLGVMPFREKPFRHCLHRCIPGFNDRIKGILQSLFWRSTKANPLIRQQLGIPEQIEKKIVLEFSSIEMHFYKKQLKDIVNALNESSTLVKNSHTDVLSLQLHSLRAACCHPQVGSRGIHRLASKSTQTPLERVLSMSQILDKLIEDARLKCEESQRITVMHMNALACITRLKCELKGRNPVPIPVSESAEQLLNKSASLYWEAIELIDTNAKPCKVVSEAQVDGSSSLIDKHKNIRNGSTTLCWRLVNERGKVFDPVWAKFEFVSATKLSAFKVRVIKPSLNTCSSEKFLSPKECVLQVSNAALGGEFVDVRTFEFDQNVSASQAWKSFDGIITNRSKLWRIYIVSYHDDNVDENNQLMTQAFACLNLEIQMMEASIGADDLQRIHILHNVSCVIDSLLHFDSSSLQSSNQESNGKTESLKLKLNKAKSELNVLEKNYLRSAKANHSASSKILLGAHTKRSEVIQEISKLSRGTSNADSWWRDLLSHIHLEMDSSVSSYSFEQLCNLIKSDLYDDIGGYGRSRFPDFDDVSGLLAALELRKGDDYLQRSCISDILSLKNSPTEAQILENSCCHKCRADWYQTGPICSHCKLEKSYIEYGKDLTKPEFLTVLRCIFRWINGLNDLECPTERLFFQDIQKRAELHFELMDCEMRELAAAKRHWRVHFNLLSAYDELKSCKSTMRLMETNESIGKIPQTDLSSIVVPSDIPALLMDHTVRQAGALAALRRDTASLRYLKNQSVERIKTDDNSNQDKPSCPVCLMEFNIVDRAVLKCGHSLHTSCLDEIMKRSLSRFVIKCPMKCLRKTKKSEVLVATESLASNDGSRIKRDIVGTWGTKVDRLVSDLVDIIGNGERCLIFSQWDDLLSIIESALSANDILFTHPKGAKMFGESAQALRTTCHVMLINVKNGAEGLTLVEATHVFMIEPLLHCGLDSQAINRVHRIGQTSKTFVHRYIIKSTIEEKIDEIRMERQAVFENVEGESSAAMITTKKVKDQIQAGGVDGSFTHEELKNVLDTI